MQEINWDELVSTANEAAKPPSQGPVRLRVESCEWKTASTGREMLKFRYKIVGGPDDGKPVFSQLVLSTDNPTALVMFMSGVRAHGVDPGSFKAVSHEQIPDLFVGKEVGAELDTSRVWNNQPQVDVKNYTLIGGAAPSMSVPPALQATPPAPEAGPAPAPAPEAGPGPGF